MSKARRYFKSCSIVLFYRLAIVLLLYGCEKPEIKETLFKALSPAQTGIHFKNEINSTFDFNIIEYNNFFNGGGVGIGDFNNDGLPDIFFAGNMTSCQLYINQGGLKFQDHTKEAGVETVDWAGGIAVVDLNQDGWQDIYVSMSGYPDSVRRTNKLFIHQGLSDAGIPTFIDMANEYGLDDTGYTTQTAFFDYDKDGDLDGYLLTTFHDKMHRYFAKPKDTTRLHQSTDRLYRNDNGKFSLVSMESGIVHEGYGLGIAVTDFNADGWPDVYVANDFIYEDRIYINNKNGSFHDVAPRSLSHQSLSSMGMDVADINNDGRADIFVLDMKPRTGERDKMMSMGMNDQFFEIAEMRGYQAQFAQNVFQLNLGIDNMGNQQFSDIACLNGMQNTEWSWSVLMADYDNDGLKDVFISNGIPRDITNNDYIRYRSMLVKQKLSYDKTKKELLRYLEDLQDASFTNFFFKNKGGLLFNDVSSIWQNEPPACTNGVAFADLDLDGDLDLIFNNLNSEAQIQENQSNAKEKNHYLRIKLKTSDKQDLVGTRVVLTCEGETQTQWYSTIRGFQSSVEDVLHFGLGEKLVVDHVEIHWPDGNTRRLSKVETNQLIEIGPEMGQIINPRSEKDTSKVFREVTGSTGVEFIHTENAFNDFKIDPLLPWQYSKNGPCISVGDVNGDKLEDFFIGGAAGVSGTFFIQSTDGQFARVEMEVGAAHEDVASLLFDADNDGDLDLYVVSGGSEFSHVLAYQDRLYLNDGSGKFTPNKSALPNMPSSGSCVAGTDFDGDGDTDLFVGGYNKPGQFPENSPSYLLRNDNGVFTDVTDVIAPTIRNPGMVTSAVWADINNDGKKDLVIGGEWMSVKIFINESNQFKDYSAAWNLESLLGFWYSISVSDLDNDGDLDILAGNLGLNTKYKASPQQPIQVYSSFFDGDNKQDAIITQYLHDGFGNTKEYPIAQYDDLSRQLNWFRDKFPLYRDYSNTVIDRLLTTEQLENATKRAVNILESVFFENIGERFLAHVLPTHAQIGPVKDMIVDDFDGDGRVDVLLVGAIKTTPAVEAWYDAQTGLVLTNIGKGNFEIRSSEKTGFWARGTNHAEIINIGNQKCIILAENLGPLRFYQYNTSFNLTKNNDE